MPRISYLHVVHDDHGSWVWQLHPHPQLGVDKVNIASILKQSLLARSMDEVMKYIHQLSIHFSEINHFTNSPFTKALSVDIYKYIWLRRAQRSIMRMLANDNMNFVVFSLALASRHTPTPCHTAVICDIWYIMWPIQKMVLNSELTGLYKF